MALQVLTFKLTETECKALDDTTRIGRFRSRSETIVHALHSFFMSHRINSFAGLQIANERLAVRKRRSNKPEEKANAETESTSKSGKNVGSSRSKKGATASA